MHLRLQLGAEQLDGWRMVHNPFPDSYSRPNSEQCMPVHYWSAQLQTCHKESSLQVSTSPALEQAWNNAGLAQIGDQWSPKHQGMER